MTANNSATGGLIVPAPSSPIPAYDGTFDQLLQALVVGVVGINGAFVRPRWQNPPPKMPDPSVDWCAIGVTDIDDFGVRGQIIHDPSAAINSPGDGSDDATNFEKVTVLSTMYGPDAWTNSALLRDGLRIAQNREALLQQQITVFSTGKRANTAELLNEQWVRRVDMPLILSRATQRVYPIFNLLSALVTIRAVAGGSGLPEQTSATAS